MSAMIRPFALALTLTATAAVAVAAGSPVQRTFGNTIVSTYPDGRQAELWLQPDGRYTAEGRRGDASSGHWNIRDDKLCLRQSSPIPSPFGYCTPIPDSGMGASWTAKAVTGEPIRVKVVKGHYARHPQARS
jgi:hypothetical protein